MELLHGLVFIAIGGAALRYGLFLGALRRQRMRRFQRDSGADAEQVAAWFRPSYGWLSDILRRGVALGFGCPLLSIGLAMVWGRIGGIPPFSNAFGSIVTYSMGVCVVLAIVCLGLFCLICAERIAGDYILGALPRRGYDYARASRDMSHFGRAGLAWSIMARVFGLMFLGIAWFVGSTILSNAMSHWHGLLLH